MKWRIGYVNKFYKSYVELNNKVPVSKKKSRFIKPEWKEVGGYLADNYVLVDIDDKDVNANLFFDIVNTFDINCHITESVHGIHAIFRKPAEKLAYGNRKETLTGVWCDYKCSNNKGYERIIIDGKQLSIINNCNEPDELPWLLFPFGRPRNLQQMQENSGRHAVFGDLKNIYALYEDDPNVILLMLNWVNENVFKEPRKSVNWTVAECSESISYMRGGLSDAEIMEKLKNVDLNKVYKLLVQYGLIK